jgi:PAS domain S-box-containing protein
MWGDVSPEEISQQLAWSEAKYRHFVQSAQEGVWVLDRSGRTTSINPAMAGILGCSVKSAIGTFLTDWMPAPAKDAAARLLEIESSGALAEVKLVRLDATEAIVRAASSVMIDEGGRHTGFMVTMTDVTALVRTRDALDVQVERFRSLFHDTPVGKVLFTPELAVLDANEAFAQLVGYPRSDLIGAPLALFTVAADVPQQTLRVRSMFEGQPPAVRARVRYVRKDGGVLAARVTLSGPVGRPGDPVCGMATILDLTEQEEISARESELAQRLHLTIETMPDAFITVTASGHVVELNPAAEKMFGWAAEEMIGRSVLDLAPSEMRTEFSGQFPKLFRERATTSWAPRESLGRRRDGSVFPAELTIVAFPLGTQMQVSLLVRDISDR